MSVKGEAQGKEERPAVIVCDAYAAEASRVHELLSPCYELVLSRAPVEALTNIVTGSFQAMVLGLHKEDRSFLELVPLLKKLHPRLPIIVIADGCSLDEQLSVQREGIFYFLPRPIGSGEILRAVANAVLRGAD